MDESSSPPPGGDAELIGAIASGDSASYVRLHERHAAAARSLARQLMTNPAEAEEVVTETFTRLHAVLRQGGGPDAAVRPYLLTAVRRVAGERSGGQPAEAPAGQAEAAVAKAEARSSLPAAAAGLGELLLSDPATAEMEREPVARAFLSLPERWRAVLWHTEIEQADPGQAAALLGLTADGVAELGEQARAGLSRAYLKLYLAGVTRDDCRSAAGKLDLHLSGAARGRTESKVQRHLRGCRACRAVAVELAGLGRSLRRAVAPVFLGPATAAYLAAVKAAPARRAGAPRPRLSPSLRWHLGDQQAARDASGRASATAGPGSRCSAAGGVRGHRAHAGAGGEHYLASYRPAPGRRGRRAVPSGRHGAVAVAGPARSRPAAPARPVTPTIPASPSPLDPDAAASPPPSPFFDHRHHRHHHHDPDQPSAP